MTPAEFGSPPATGRSRGSYRAGAVRGNAADECEMRVRQPIGAVGCVTLSVSEDGLLKRGARLAQQDLLGPLVGGIGLRRGVTHSRKADTSVLGEAADHVEHDATLPRLVEVQAMASDNVKQVVDSEATQQWRFEVVGCHEVFLSASRRQEECRVRVVAPVGEELEGEERVRCSALA